MTSYDEVQAHVKIFHSDEKGRRPDKPTEVVSNKKMSQKHDSRLEHDWPTYFGGESVPVEYISQDEIQSSGGGVMKDQDQCGQQNVDVVCGLEKPDFSCKS